MTKQILIVDDHLLVREGLRLIIESNDAYQIAGEAENGEEALRLVDQLQPDLILMDLNMPVMTGLETMKRLRDKKIEIPVVILTTYNEDDYMMQGLALGAKGYLLKDASRATLFHTLESALRGETLLQPDVVEKVFASRQAPVQASKSGLPDLSEKEKLVLQAAARGYRSKEIAFDLGISERTVKAHLTSIYNKLGVDSRPGAVAMAIEHGLIHL
ncbi:DNA-binding response regulator [Paenibacillus nanensis]|uniref:DNA-binding response regulator n=1 Tax=Paenibacillus nanensis TaxID=393251 RepID=A0A3A1UV67_9BACL|nr:response regulator transcription factor [Paenibacillus nanensis]RIX52439.1 DNA-binding response regulator [Paenibacillus nanensis]